MHWQPSMAAEVTPLCKGSPLVVAACFTVHGRLSLANGAFTVRIWPVGTHRMLGVADGDGKMHWEDGPVLPKAVIRILASRPRGEVGVFGNYELCRLTREEPGHMQSVCVENASQLVGGAVH